MQTIGIWLRSQLVFCLASAALMVAGRIAIFDYQLFRAEAIPNHDMSQGLAFFTTNMHSLRLTGEIAWWNPICDNGYAEYYQSFLSPLAPTPHHVVFIGWSQGMRVLRRLGVLIPEYVQYLAVNYVVLPFLTFVAFGLLTSQLFRRRATVFLMLVSYTFSGIGLWNSAWFYFQEPATLFFLLAAIVAVLRRPTVPRLAGFGAAALVQLTSMNYWTVYNSWFILIFVVSYSLIYPQQLRRLGRRVVCWTKRAPLSTAALGAMAVLVLAVWGVLLASIVREQKAAYVRNLLGQPSETYTWREACVVPDTRKFTTELFNPSLPRALQSYRSNNEIHNARYVGAFVLPLLVLGLAGRWGRRERFLLAVAVAVLVVCLAPPLLLEAWKAVPMMDRIRHLFYFYSHHWQLLVLLLSGSGMEVVLRPNLGPAVRERLRRVALVLAGLAFLLVAIFGSLADHFPVGDLALQGNLVLGLLAGFCALAALQVFWHPSASARRLFVFVVLVLAVADLTRYFWESATIDQGFTRKYCWHDPERLAEQLNQPWHAPAPNYGFEANLVSNLAIGNWFWPRNNYLWHRGLWDAKKSRCLCGMAIEGPPIEYFPTAERADSPGDADAWACLQSDSTAGARVLLLQGRDATVSTLPNQTAALAPSQAGSIASWTYNTLELEANAPAAGWLYIRQLYDPVWRVTVDGRRVEPVQANFAGMAVAVEPGFHRVRMDYRPLARRLYQPACGLLGGSLLMLGFVAIRSQGRRTATGRRSATATMLPVTGADTAEAA